MAYKQGLDIIESRQPLMMAVERLCDCLVQILPVSPINCKMLDPREVS